MRAAFLGMCLALMSLPPARAQQAPVHAPTDASAEAEQELLDLSRQKWRWMADRDVDARADLFHDEAVFVHMGGP